MKTSAQTLVFRVGRDDDGTPCLDVYRNGILPIGYITRSQLMEVLQGPPSKRATGRAIAKGKRPSSWPPSAKPKRGSP